LKDRGPGVIWQKKVIPLKGGNKEGNKLCCTLAIHSPDTKSRSKSSVKPAYHKGNSDGCFFVKYAVIYTGNTDGRYPENFE